MGSTRLKNKMVSPIMGKPLLAHVIKRVKEAKTIDSVIVATTVNPADKTIIRIASKCGVASFMGSEEDVLDRYYRAAKEFRVSTIIRVTGDCPLIDPHLIDIIVRRYLEGDCDYVTNTMPLTYPDGLDASAFSFKTLERAWREATLASEREHVTAYIRKNPDIFKIVNIASPVNLSHLRWSVDEERDLEFIRQVYAYLYKEEPMFYTEDVLHLLSEHPELLKINQGIPTNEGYAKSLKEDKIVK